MQHEPSGCDNRPGAFTNVAPPSSEGRNRLTRADQGDRGPDAQDPGSRAGILRQRRGWDLNPRTSYPVTSLAGRPDRPDSGTSPCCVADRTQPGLRAPPTMPSGAVAERTNAPVLKTGDPQGSEGSNPSRSAKRLASASGSNLRPGARLGPDSGRPLLLGPPADRQCGLQRRLHRGATRFAAR